jgi:hypothetical protein
MYLIILLLGILNYSYANKNFIANSFYQNNDCKDLNYIIYSYNDLDNCKDLLNDNICNNFSIYSNKQYCGDDSLEDTKKKIKEFLSLETYDNNCENKIGSFSIKLNKCISFMDITYIKITKSNNYYKSTNYLDPICTEKYTPEKLNEKGLDLTKCLNKIKIYTNNGELKITENNNIEEIQNNLSNSKYKMNKFILTCIFSILLIFILIL